ncbi:hypothetical protein Tco_0333087 [Tanacetum coccineum]
MIPFNEKSTSRLAHLAPISPEIVEACVDDDDTDEDDDYDFYDCVDIEEEGGEIDFEISKIDDFSPREKFSENVVLDERERITKTKRSKNDQKPTKNGRDKSKSEETAKRSIAVIRQTQSKKETKKSKTQNKVKGPRMPRVQSFKSLLGSFEV